jgi:anti-sigma regulatory factor (Ser/Thr protein kinase)
MSGHRLRVAADTADGTDQCWLAPAVEMAAVASGNWPLSPEPGPLGWTCFPRVALRTLGADARSVRAARDFTLATLLRWGAAQRGEDVAIVVSELLTNALRHALPDPRQTPARSQIRLGLLQPGPCVLCAVADPSRRLPVLKEPGDLAETGRGLHVIGALADAWGYTTPGDAGKVVWAMFSADRAPRPGAYPRPARTDASTRQVPTARRGRVATRA